MERYITQIKWVDPNGNGLISYFSFKGTDWKAAEMKAKIAFKKYVNKVYLTVPKEVDVRKISTDRFFSGLVLERPWKNPK